MTPAGSRTVRRAIGAALFLAGVAIGAAMRGHEIFAATAGGLSLVASMFALATALVSETD